MYPALQPFPGPLVLTHLDQRFALRIPFMFIKMNGLFPFAM
jgi:hypothetical protein